MYRELRSVPSCRSKCSSLENDTMVHLSLTDKYSIKYIAVAILYIHYYSYLATSSSFLVGVCYLSLLKDISAFSCWSCLSPEPLPNSLAHEGTGMKLYRPEQLDFGTILRGSVLDQNSFLEGLEKNVHLKCTFPSSREVPGGTETTPQMI